jgi:hypothetical protein
MLPPCLPAVRRVGSKGVHRNRDVVCRARGSGSMCVGLIEAKELAYAVR